MGLPAGPDPDGPHDSGGGLVVHDFDGDGHRDVLLSWELASPGLARGGPDGFRAEAVEAPDSLRQPSLVDLDQDGDLDVLFGTNQRALTALVAGPDGLVAASVGEVARGQAEVRELEPGDLDGDGVPELFVAFIGELPDPAAQADRLGRLDGAAVVLDDPLPPETASRPAFDALWFDHEGDGDLDAYVINDRGAEHGGNALWRNDGGVLIDASAGSGADVRLDGMGGDAADLDGDGLDDLLVVGTAQAALLLAQPDGTYVDAARAWGFELHLRGTAMAWGVLAADVDNDGDRDVLVAHGDQWGPNVPHGVVQELPFELYERAGGHFEPVGHDLGLARDGSWRGVVATDLNADGVLDLLVSDVVGRPHLYRSTGCTAAAWLTVRAPPDTRVVVEAGGQRWADTARTGSSYGAAASPEVHVGLGEHDTVDRVTLVAPGAAPVVVEGPIDARRVLGLQLP